MSLIPTQQTVIGQFVNPRRATFDFLQLASSQGGQVFGWIDSDGHLQGSLVNSSFTSPITFLGSISGQASIGVAAVAGTPNTLLLPTTTGIAGQALVTDGNNPQQLSWSTAAVDLPFGVDTGAANAYVVNASPAVSATLGQTIVWTTTNPNTGPSTINVNGTGVKNLLNPSGAALVTGNIIAGVEYSAVFDGQEWVLGGFGSIPGNNISLAGVVTLVSLDPASGFNNINGAPLILLAKNPPATRQPLLAFGNAAGTSSTFIGFDNDNVCVFGAINTRFAFLSGSAPEFFDAVSIVNNTSFVGNDLFVQPSLGGANKSGGSMLNVLSGDGGSQFTFNFQNVLSLSTLTPATSLANQSSPVFKFGGTWWDGATSHASLTSIQDIEGSGTNPTNTTTISNSGAFNWAGVSIVGQLQFQNSTTGSAAYIQSKTFTVTSAQIKGANTSPTQVLPAPGAGKAYQIVSTMSHYRFGTTAYTLNGSTALELGYGAGKSNPYDLAASSGFIDQTSDRYTTGSPLTTNGGTTADVVNGALFFFSNANPTVGDGTITLSIQYTIIDTTIS